MSAEEESQIETLVMLRRMALLAWYQLGDLYLKRNRPDEAREAYGRVLELPDFQGMHGRAREARDGIGQDP